MEILKALFLNIDHYSTGGYNLPIITWNRKKGIWVTKVTWIHIDESKFNNNDGWAKQFIFYFLIILIKTDITFGRAKEKILRQNIKKENKCNLWLLTLFLPLNTKEISSLWSVEEWNLHLFTFHLVSFSAMFVSWNSFFGKPLSKLFCVCLPLEKLINGKHFPVNGKHFPVNGNPFRSTENTFQSKKNLVWFPGKCFSF